VRALRESEERFRQVTETIQQAFWLRDIDPPAVLYASPAVERIFGVSRDVFYRDPLALQALLHPDDRASVLAQRDAMAGPDEREFRIVRPDGETRWIRTRSAVVRFERGRVSRIAAVSEDITEEIELRDALVASEERFRLLAENSRDVIRLYDAEGRIRYASPSCRDRLRTRTGSCTTCTTDSSTSPRSRHAASSTAQHARPSPTCESTPAPATSTWC
jgi:PAS domain S-box-containing protein